MIRVNLAGENGAVDICNGQIATIKSHIFRNELQQMLEQEQKHLLFFTNFAQRNKVRPTIMSPIWKIGAVVLGKVTGMMGEKFAAATISAIEEVIAKHYQKQLIEIERIIKTMSSGEIDMLELQSAIEEFKNDELNHKQTALQIDFANNKIITLHYKMVKIITIAAVKISKAI
jgi:ubiquinone biosynthesis monooxygenase Coq7